ncbi:hypothetical protein GYMLUDRAFT_179178 [Collybiopsis luxurians FD-317 M1]|uniref:Unplaced genomic scaffold GYMLUscaffold_83, whole genome shotgun sequence n=1 Tax=Collybiopsis luxurians FD-317 M1 TaxID=944289 RepID=A0A0D0BUI2_9AGAR|nr:hypothetical protein GYMLUDRAFT_179178 [Collybiopsis luxurians FD-317 M1]
MPSQENWVSFSSWADTYGELTTALGQHIIVVNNFHIAKEMLNKKSAIYSDRPVLQVGGELVGYNNTTGLLRYGPRHQTQRAFFHRVMGTNVAMKDINSIEELETRRFLKRMLAEPHNLAENVRKTTGAIILKVSHGYEIQEKNDPFVAMADKVLDDVTQATAPGSFVADLFPICNYLPEWLPGAGFKRRAAVWRSRIIELVEKPHQLVKDEMAAGTAKKSFTSSILEEEKNLSTADEHEVKWTAASIFSGGADTTVGAIMAFFLAMILYPEVQKKAQAELDAILGKETLPKLVDRERLPYLNALTLEVLRWHSVVPSALPHRVMEDDIQSGYYIPKDALVLPNIWKMSHDPAIYSTPMAFNPDRFLGPDAEMDSREVTFGFGRRICPGKLVADASLFIACAMTLTVFNIGVPNGARAKGDLKPTPGSISHPTEFDCVLTPRSKTAAVLIQNEDMD